MTYRTLLLLTLTVPFVIGGCAPVVKAPPVVTPQPAADAQARALEAQGDWLAAAQEYLRIARAEQPPASLDFLLSAVTALIKADDLTQARQRLDEVQPAADDTIRALHKRILLGRIALAQRDPAQALSLIEPPWPSRLPSTLLAAAHELRADAYAMTGNHLEAARERVQRAPLLSQPEAIRHNEEAIWERLTGLSAPALAQLRTQPPPDVFSGWLELAYIAKTHRLDPGALQIETARWRERYPAHPASAELIGTVLRPPPEALLRPRSLALLLPLASRYARAASAVRDGFLAAYYADRDNAQRPAIQIYDVTPDTAWAVYQQAIAEGAEFVVGPLSKQAVDMLARGGEFVAPVLTLNYADQQQQARQNLYQFGLSPEGEAHQVAERVWLDGLGQGIAVVPDSAWGERVAQAFATRCAQFGCTLMETQRYPAESPDYSALLKALLKIDESEGRYRALRTTLRQDIEFEARRRGDIDFIFVAASPREARQLIPGLRFYHADDVPMYSTSHIYGGGLDASADRDMEGVLFGDMPWILDATGGQTDMRQRIERWWPDATAYLRLYALGIDAYNVIPHLRQLALHHDSYSGQTGALEVDEYNRIVRQLSWAQFRNGVPLPRSTEPRKP